MVSEPILVHTQILDQMADSSNTAAGAVTATPPPTPPLAEKHHISPHSKHSLPYSS
jgi:hypothetical protein